MILLLMDMPKPLHGMSAVNKNILDRVEKSGVDYQLINSCPSFAFKYFGTRFWVLIRLVYFFYVFLKLFAFMLRGGVCSVYRPINGGSGQFYDICYVAMARILKKKIFIHHHSYAYLTKKSKLYSFFQAVLGYDAMHIVLGPEMKASLCNMYALPEGRVLVLSNSAFFNCDAEIEHFLDSDLIRIGYLANISFEKGFREFLTIYGQLKDRLNGVAVECHIAGGFSSQNERVFFEKYSEDALVNYYGPVYGEDKDSFYKKLDVFIFPSFYVNEAEPLVLYEAAATGALLAGTEQGCMSSVISALGGVSVPAGAETVSQLVEKLLNAKSDGLLEDSGRIERLERYRKCVVGSKVQLDRLIKVMVQ